MTVKTLGKVVFFGAFILMGCVIWQAKTTHKAFAGIVSNPICTPSDHVIFGRCEYAGYFTGATSQDANLYYPLPNSNPAISNAAPQTTGIFGNYYPDTVLAATRDYWSFPTVGGCNYYQADTSNCTKNSPYAQEFIGLMEDYLAQWNDDVFPGGAAPTSGVCAGEAMPPHFNADSTCNVDRGEAEGAAMIVDTMLGEPGDASTYGCAQWGGAAMAYNGCKACKGSNWFYDCYEPTINKGVAYAVANFGTWSNRVTDYDFSGLINWDQTVSFPAATPGQNCPNSGHWNSTGIDDGTDIQTFCNVNSEIDNFIVVTVPGVGKFYINRSCGNIVGNSVALKALGLPTVACGSPAAATNPMQPVSGASFSLKLSFTVQLNPPLEQDYAGGTMTVSVPGSGLTFTPITPVGGSPPGGSETYSSLTAPAPGTYSGSFTLSSGNASNVPITCPISFTVMSGAYPYFSVNGGDSVAGSLPASYSPSCKSSESNNDGSIVGPNSGSNTNAGDQLALQAIGEISGFASDYGGVSPPYGLDFANITGGYTPGDFGSAPCMPNLGNAPASCSNLSPTLINTATSSYAKGSVSVVCPPGGTFTVGGSTIPTVNIPTNDSSGDSNLTVYVNGNLVIASNIEFQGTWTDVTNIPVLNFVVTNGNIYIEPQVTQLDGVYYAQASTASPTTTGIIYTCANPVTMGYAGGGTNCGGSTSNADADNTTTQLTVNGSFIANSIAFERTGGSDVNPNDASEVFNYGPATWLAGINLNKVPYTYDAIADLPPVL